MSDEQGRKSRVLVWTLCILVFILAYVPSAPWVEVFGHKHPRFDVMGGLYCQPYDWLSKHTPFQEQMLHYRAWCWEASGVSLYNW